ncbi:DUF3137 domain-containing protein [Rhizobium alvei]|uniref:DUF3137 domain-containing protein n=1 Tax=Rhizobium alvei TaxID=1132659 RepID=A0ABT8YHR1_9HYPH|nr:DUF3137 domain-containing protein [Rhizobium alvei]MDO6963225.1 DUF3137 domain-containing protein [Rhizobium alvei]
MEEKANSGQYMPDAERRARAEAAIDEYNVERPQILSSAYLQVAMYFGGYIIFSALLLYGAYANDDAKHRLFGFTGALLMVGAFYVWDFAWKPVKDHQMVLRYRLFPEIFGFVENVDYSHGQQPWFLEDLKQLKLLRFTRSKNDDALSGNHEGLDFSLVETSLVSGSGKNETTLFKGLVFHFPLDHPFDGTLIVARRGNWLQEKVRDLFGNRDDVLECGDPEIDAFYEFRSSNLAAAQPLIQGALASALRFFSRDWRDGDVLMALDGKACYLLLPSKKDYFALPSITEDIDFARDAEPMIRDLVVLLALAHLVRKLG